MIIETTDLQGVLILKPQRFSDDRGYFCESWNQARMAEAGLNIAFVQDNLSLSRSVGTVRGLHYQTPPHAQTKLVRCARGALFDVAVDIRADSETFGRWVGVELTAENGKQLLVPAGFAHGFVTRQPDTEIAYKCSDYYAPDCDRAIRFDDADINIDWGIDPANAILSDKDRNAPSLARTEVAFTVEDLA